MQIGYPVLNIESKFVLQNSDRSCPWKNLKSISGKFQIKPSFRDDALQLRLSVETVQTV